MLKITKNFIKQKKNIQFLRYSTAALPRTQEQHARKQERKTNSSFMANIFRGNLVAEQVFPYPDIFDAEFKEFTQSLKEPFFKIL